MSTRAWVVSLVGIVIALATAHPREAAACVRASETNRLLGWSADGQYALFGLVGDDGALRHAEIHPTTYQGSVYVIVPDGDGAIAVTRVTVGGCASFADDDATVVERARGALTEKTLLDLATVKAMSFGRDEVTPAAGAARPRARFTGKKRYDVHDLELTAGATKTIVPLPVWCVGSCLRDEAYQKWTATVDAVHTLPSGVVLYEVRMPKVCNGGTIIRLVQPTPPAVTIPKARCRGSG